METLNTQLQPFFEWLLRATLQASLMVCLILLLQRILRSKLGIRWHYGLWMLLLVRMSLPWAPQSKASLFNLIPQSVYQQQIEYVQPETNEQKVGSDLTSSAPVEAVPASGAVTIQKSPDAVSATPTIKQDVQYQFKPDLSKMIKLLPLFWLIGALVLFLYVCTGNFNLWRIVKSQRPLIDQKILELLEDCKSQMGIQTILGIVTTNKVKSPALFGFIRPRLLLPTGMIENLSSEELRFVFLHELAHLKRRDIYIGWLISVLQVLHWFNPLVWLAFRRMRADRELACDALVLDRMQSDEPKSYGRIIVSLLERFSRPRFLPGLAGIMENKSQLKRRITMIARFKKNSYQWSPLAIIMMVMLACVSVPNAISIEASRTLTMESAPKISLRRVWSGPDVDLEGAPSPDGRYISYMDPDTGDLAVYEIATGKKRRLTNKGSWDESDEFAQFSTWSPDGQQIVYDWYNKDDFIELRIVGLDGSKPRILYRNEQVTWAQTYDWSPDGKHILAVFQRKNQTAQIVLVSVSDGSERIIKTYSKWPGNVSMSPDGRYLAYDLSSKDNSPSRDVFLLSIDDNREAPLVEHPADDHVLGWTPDGKHILFVTDRTGSPGIWVTRVIEGNPQGDPELVKTSNGPFSPVGLGFTRDGAFYYGYRQNRTDVYITEIDPATGKIVKPPREAINRFVESNGTPAYSPDGKYLAYVSRRPPMRMRYTTNPVGNVLCVRSLETGEDNEFRPALNYFGWPRWSPDGRSVLVVAWGRKSRMGYYQIDTQTGNVTPVLQTGGMNLFGGHEWSFDGKTIYFGRLGRKPKRYQLCVRDIESGKEEVIYGSNDRFDISLSPDGRQLSLLFISNENQSLNVMPATGGELRELCSFEKADGFKFGRNCSMTWTGDGKYIFYTVKDSKSDNDKWELCRIPAEGGESQRLGLKMGDFVCLSVHPDGRHIAFSTRRLASSEVWVMENFLPEVAAPVTRPAQQPDFKKIWIPTQPGGGVLSPDGEKLAFVSEGSLWIVPVHGKVSPDIAGEPVRLTEPMGAWDVASLLSWSADGKWIAFNTSDEKEDAIYVIPSSGGPPRKVPVEPRLRNSVFNYRISLSPDGKVVAFSSRNIDKTGAEPPEEAGLPPSVRGFFIYTVPVAGGEVRRLTDNASGEPAFSPDGKKIAFVKYYTSERGQLCGSLWVVPAAGGNPVQVCDPDPLRRVAGPVWSPDGKMIAYNTRTMSDRKGVCIVPVSETGKSLASPTKIELPLNTLDMLAGWTCDNKIGVFLHKPAQWAIHTVPASGGHAVQVSPSGGAAHPQWSPDGKRIYFRWDGGEIAHVPSGGGALSIGPVKRDETFYLVYPGSGNAVSPDGRQIVFCAGKRISPKNKEPYREVNIYTVPVEGGEPTKIAQDGRYPCWSPDGKSIAFIRTYQRPVKREFGWNIYIVPSKGGEIRQLTSDSDDVRRTHIDFSPDGKSIAYFAKDKTLRIIPVQGGEARILVQAEELKNHDQLAWSPDGSKLVYSSKGSIWTVSSDGGEPAEIRTGLDAKAAHVSFSPDGRKLAFTAITDGEEDLYLIENFLPGTPVAKPEPTPTLRQIEVRGRGSVHSRPSFDGKYILDVDEETGNLVARELATAKERVLTKNSDPNRFVHGSLISRDSKRAAFYHFNPDKEDFDLRLVGLDGSGLRTLLGAEIAGYFNMDAWSPDGKYIFGKLMKKPVQLVRLSTDDGSIEVLKTFDQGGASNIDVSADGRYLAYSRAEQKNSKPDIFVFDLEQNIAAPLVTHPAADKLLGWTPNGQHIFFTSDRNGTWDGWLLRVVDGKPDGLPEVIKAGMGDVSPIGFTRSGSFYYNFRHEAWNVYTAKLDLNTGEALSAPSPVRHEGKDVRPDFSPDGRYLAYCSQPDRDKPQIIRIRTLATGQERQLKTELPHFDWLRWCPDSRHLLITNFNRGSLSVVYKLDVQTGEHTVLVQSDEQRIRQAEFSADGKTLAYRIRGSGNANRLIIRDMETGREKELLRSESMGAAALLFWTLSPDGKHVALSIVELSIGEGRMNRAFVLKIISVASGEARTVVGDSVGELAWTSDGRDLLFVKGFKELWRVSAEGGEPRKLWEWKQKQMLWGLRIHPDGQRFAFFSGGNVSEMWVMENFLPMTVAVTRK